MWNATAPLVAASTVLHCRLPRAASRVGTRWEVRVGNWGGVWGGGRWATRRHAGFYRRRAGLCGLRVCRQCRGRWRRGRQRQRRGRQWWRGGETNSRGGRIGRGFSYAGFMLSRRLESEEAGQVGDRAGAQVGAGWCGWRDFRFACRLRDNGQCRTLWRSCRVPATCCVFFCGCC